MCLSFFTLMKARSKEEWFELGTEYVEVCVGLTGVHSAGLTWLPRQLCCLFILLYKVDLNYKYSCIKPEKQNS